MTRLFTNFQSTSVRLVGNVIEFVEYSDEGIIFKFIDVIQMYPHESTKCSSIHNNC